VLSLWFSRLVVPSFGGSGAAVQASGSRWWKLRRLNQLQRQLLNVADLNRLDPALSRASGASRLGCCTSQTGVSVSRIQQLPCHLQAHFPTKPLTGR
jgi:hypothetical protein